MRISVWKAPTGGCIFQTVLNIFPLYVLIRSFKKHYLGQITCPALLGPGRLKGDRPAGRQLKIASTVEWQCGAVRSRSSRLTHESFASFTQVCWLTSVHLLFLHSFILFPFIPLSSLIISYQSNRSGPRLAYLPLEQ